MKRKFLSLILVFAMTVSLLTVGTGAVEPTYGDTAGHWAESSIERWSGHGIIQGSNGLFDPNGQLTCAQLATILAKLLKLPAAKDAGFTDNTADAWYYDAVNRCAAAGILNGNGDSTVTPEAPITRERAMVMLARALGIEPLRNPDLTRYTDAAQVSAYAQGYVAALIEAGIVGGVTADELAPQDNINRASTVTILDRAISTYADEAGATVKVDGKGIVLVVAENVKITGAPEGTKIVVADGATDLTVNGKSVSNDQTYVVPEATTPSTPSGGGSVHSHSYDNTTLKCSCGQFRSDVVATVGDTHGYTTLVAAVEATKSGDTITLLKNVQNAEGMTVASGKNFTIDFNGFTYELNKPGAGSTGTETSGFQLLKDSTVVMKNGTITISEDNLTPATVGKNIMRIIQNYANLTLQDMIIDGTNQYGGAKYIMSFNNQPVLITGNTNIIATEGQVAFDADGNWGGYERCKVTINTTGTIVGNIELGQGYLEIQNANVKGGIVLCTSCGTDETMDQTKRISITGGTFSSNPSEYVAPYYKATKNGDVWEVAMIFAGGTGTAEDPFVIQNAEQFKAFRDNVNAGDTFAGKTIKLMADIDLNNEEWTPIGTSEHPFSGSFDGQNHTVSNLKITNADSYNGLFGKVVGITDGASYKIAAGEVWNAETYTLSNCEESQFKTIIKDFTIDHFSVMTGEYGAAAIGWAENAYLSKISVSNGSVNDNNATKKGKIAAVVGVSAKNMVYDQLTTAEDVQVVGGKHSVAGIVSSIQRGNNEQPHLVVIKNCVNKAEVQWIENGGTSGGLPIAGIVANAGSCSGLEVVIYQCTNNGKITANECSYACGIVGQAGDWVKAIYDCHNTGNITAQAVEYGVAGICITESIPAIACSNSGTLTNNADGEKTYDISSSISQLTIVDETFANVAELQTRINNAVGTAKTLILKNITVSDTTGMLTIPDGIQHISANTKVCGSISLPDALVNIDMIGLTQTVTGTVCRTFSGSGNRITVEANTTIGDIVIAGTDNAFTNNGTMGNVAISGNGTDIVINNVSGATMAGMTMIATTATATLNNHGTMNRTAGGHCVWVEANGKLTVNNYGSISATNSYALLFYGNCTIIVNAYKTSTVTGDFAPYRGTHTITVNYHTDATYNGGSWTNLPAYSQYGVTVSVMQ